MILFQLLMIASATVKSNAFRWWYWYRQRVELLAQSEPLLTPCNVTSRPASSKMKMLLCLTKSVWVIYWFPCDENLMKLSTLYMLHIHFCIIKEPVALGPAIWRRSSFSQGVACCTGTRNMTAFLMERRKVVARCIISFCKSSINHVGSIT